MLERKWFWIDGDNGLKDILSSISYAVVNGKPRECYSGSRGIRQGGLHSPFLLTMMDGVLTQMLSPGFEGGLSRNN